MRLHTLSPTLKAFALAVVEVVAVVGLQLLYPLPPHHHQPRRRRRVPGKVTASAIHAILSTTASARIYVLMVSVCLALVGRGVDGSM